MKDIIQTYFERLEVVYNGVSHLVGSQDDFLLSKWMSKHQILLILLWETTLVFENIILQRRKSSVSSLNDNILPSWGPYDLTLIIILLMTLINPNDFQSTGALQSLKWALVASMNAITDAHYYVTKSNIMTYGKPERILYIFFLIIKKCPFPGFFIIVKEKEMKR